MDITLEEVEAQLSQTGQLEWELAKTKALVLKQQQRIAELERDSQDKESPKK